MILPGFSGIIIAGSGYPGLQLVTTVDDTTGRTGSYTFSGVNFGPVYPNRTIIVTTHLFSNTNTTLNISTVTIGGLSAAGSDTGEGSTTGPVTVGAGIFAAKPSGTSGTVVVNFASGTANLGCEINVISVATTSATATATYNITPTGSGRNSDSGTLNVPAKGVVIAALSRGNTSTITTFTGPTKLRDVIFNSPGRLAIGGSEGLSANASYAVGWSSTGTVSGYVAKSYAGP